MYYSFRKTSLTLPTKHYFI